MNQFVNILKLGIQRGWIEYKITVADPQTIVWTLIITGIFLTVLWFQRGADIGGVSLALLTLPSLIGMNIASSGFNDVASALAYDREDGTLLRAKAVPKGINSYLIARGVGNILMMLTSMVILLIPSIFIAPGIFSNFGADDALIFLALLVVGLLATAPFGAVIGSIVKSAGSGWGLTLLPLVIITAISGIFYPITALAGWVQIIAQIFPVYWLGLGMRSTFLPDSAAAVELTGSWRTGETFLILAGWAIVGLIIAPRIMRRMTRRATGSDMAAGRERTIQRGY